MQGSPYPKGGEIGLLSPVLAAGICSRDGVHMAEPGCPRPCPVLWGCVLDGGGNAMEWLGVHRGGWQCPGVRSHGDTERVVPAWVAAGAGVSPAAALKPHQRNR